jgi:hypothetical protein
LSLRSTLCSRLKIIILFIYYKGLYYDNILLLQKGILGYSSLYYISYHVFPEDNKIAVIITIFNTTPHFRCANKYLISLFVKSEIFRFIIFIYYKGLLYNNILLLQKGLLGYSSLYYISYLVFLEGNKLAVLRIVQLLELKIF